MAGYIKLHRGWRDSDVFKRETYCHRAAWVWLLENTAWKECRRRDAHGNLLTVGRGQIHTSARALGQAWGWSKNKADRFLRDLEKCRMVDRQTDQHGVLLTICNYEKYQGELEADGPRNGSVADQSRTTQEEVKERKKKDRARGRAFDRVGCPDGVPDQLWSDFVDLRRRKSAPVTATALAGIKREADKAGWSLADALTECSLRGWQGFKAEWVQSRERDTLIC